MKKLIIIIFLLLPSYLFSEWEWEMLMENVLYAIIIHEDIIYIGTDDGIKKSTDNGDTWQDFALNDNFIYHIEFVNNNIYVLGKDSIYSLQSLFYFSNDLGKTWSLLTIPDSNEHLEFVVFNNDIIYAISNSRFYITFDNGETWERKLKSPHKGLVSIGIDDLGYIYLGTTGALDIEYEIYVSTDLGETWEIRVNGINLFDRETGVDQFNIIGDSIFVITYRGVYLSTNQGNYWYRITEINFQVIKLLIYKNIMFVGTDSDGTYGGLYYTFFGSDKTLSVGLRENIYEMIVNETTNTIFTVTYNYKSGKGYITDKLYRASLDHVTSVQDTDVRSNELQIYPNPTSGLLHIQTEALISHAVLSDLLGRKVYSSDAMYSSDELKINIEGLSAGMYFLKLYTAGGEVLTEKVVVR